MSVDNILELHNISKTFFGIHALSNVNLKIKRGTVHALMGENGAGKSTLIKIICGVLEPDKGGKLIFNGETIHNNSPHTAKKLGIRLIHQEHMLINDFTVAENLFLHDLPKKRGMVNRKQMNAKTRQVLELVGSDVSPTQKVKGLSVAEQQMIEIAKAVNSNNISIVVMDEPTAPLTQKEINSLFSLVEELKKKGVTIIYISHHLQEVLDIADDITILRDGEYITTKAGSELSNEKLIEYMVGRNMEDEYPPRTNKPTQEIVLEANNLCDYSGRVNGASLKLKKGEILGIAGLVGAGRSELLNLIYSSNKKKQGQIKIYGKDSVIKSTKAAKKLGLGLVPEDRKGEGLVLLGSVEDNITLACLSGLTKASVVDNKKKIRLSEKYINELLIKTSSRKQQVLGLSGGNQQKIVIAKWLANETKILLLDEPTRGIDVKAKYEIYTLINKLTGLGVSIIMVSSELNELLALADRIMVLSKGRITGEFLRDEFDSEHIMSCAFGITTNKREVTV